MMYRTFLFYLYDQIASELPATPVSGGYDPLDPREWMNHVNWWNFELL